MTIRHRFIPIDRHLPPFTDGQSLRRNQYPPVGENGWINLGIVQLHFNHGKGPSVIRLLCHATVRLRLWQESKNIFRVVTNGLFKLNVNDGTGCAVVESCC